LPPERVIVGDRGPLFLYNLLVINKNQIEQILHSGELDFKFFIVDITIHTNNRIQIFVDNNKGITIGECARISKLLEQQLLETNENLVFELNVSSPGIDTPFKVKQQYEKSIGKKIELIDQEDKKMEGILLKVDADQIIIEDERITKVPGRKKKEVIKKEITIPLKNIKLAKLVLSFK
jgi:ribosome maturation factor RimP